MKYCIIFKLTKLNKLFINRNSTRMSTYTEPTASKRYSEAFKGLKVAIWVADCDVYIQELHIRLKKLEDFSASLITRLNEQDEVVKLLKEEVKKVEVVGTGSTSNKGQSWSSFFETGLTKQKTTARYGF